MDVCERLGYTQNEVSGVVQATLDAITESLIEGNRLEIRNFGVFEHKVRDARLGRNPRTGAAVDIDSKRVVVFKPGKHLKEKVQHQGSNGHAEIRPDEPLSIRRPGSGQ